MRILRHTRKPVRPKSVPVDSQLISMARTHHCALFPHLTLKPSSIKRGSLALFVTGVRLPIDFPVALIPCSSLLSINTVLDTDRSHLFPGVPDIANALEHEEYLEMLDTVVLSYYLMCQLAQQSRVSFSTEAQATSWTAINLNLLQMQNLSPTTVEKSQQSLDDTIVFQQFCNECYDQLAGVFPVGRRSLFCGLMQYVLRSLMVIDEPLEANKDDDHGDARKHGNLAPAAAAVLAPFLDVVGNKFTSDGNIRIAKVDLATAKEIVREAPLLGAQQYLRNPKRDEQEEFLVLTTVRDVENDVELSVSCDSSLQGSVSGLSLVDRIRYGV